MAPDPLHIAVLLGSTREGRIGPTVARWLLDVAGQHPDLTFDLVDLADPKGVGAAAKTLLDQLAWWAVALRDARRARPYAA